MAKSHEYVKTKPQDPHVIRAEVVASTRITPTMQRITVGGAGIAHFTPLGFDQWFRLFLPQGGQEELRLPTATSALWYAQFLAMPKDKKPVFRNYTARAFRPATADSGAELDIDFVLHEDADGHAGPASTWAMNARVGDSLGILDQGLGYNPAATETVQLLAADETGMPALLSIVASLPADARARVFIEIPSSADAQEVEAPAGVEIIWVPRSDPQSKPGELVLQTVIDAGPGDATSAYVVGESALVTGLRRHLVTGLGWPKGSVTFIGYWRFGVAGG